MQIFSLYPVLNRKTFKAGYANKLKEKKCWVNFLYRRNNHLKLQF